MRIAVVGWFVERGSVHLLADGLLDYLAGNLHEVSLLAGTF